MSNTPNTQDTSETIKMLEEHIDANGLNGTLPDGYVIDGSCGPITDMAKLEEYLLDGIEHDIELDIEHDIVSFDSKGVLLCMKRLYVSETKPVQFGDLMDTSVWDTISSMVIQNFEDKRDDAILVNCDDDKFSSAENMVIQQINDLKHKMMEEMKEHVGLNETTGSGIKFRLVFNYDKNTKKISKFGVLPGWYDDK